MEIEQVNRYVTLETNTLTAGGRPEGTVEEHNASVPAAAIVRARIEWPNVGPGHASAVADALGESGDRATEAAESLLDAMTSAESMWHSSHQQPTLMLRGEAAGLVATLLSEGAYVLHGATSTAAELLQHAVSARHRCETELTRAGLGLPDGELCVWAVSTPRDATVAFGALKRALDVVVMVARDVESAMRVALGANTFSDLANVRAWAESGTSGSTPPPDPPMAPEAAAPGLLGGQGAGGGGPGATGVNPMVVMVNGKPVWARAAGCTGPGWPYREARSGPGARGAPR